MELTKLEASALMHILRKYDDTIFEKSPILKEKEIKDNEVYETENKDMEYWVKSIFQMDNIDKILLSELTETNRLILIKWIISDFHNECNEYEYERFKTMVDADWWIPDFIKESYDTQVRFVHRVFLYANSLDKIVLTLKKSIKSIFIMKYLNDTKTNNNEFNIYIWINWNYLNINLG